MHDNVNFDEDIDNTEAHSDCKPDHVLQLPVEEIERNINIVKLLQKKGSLLNIQKSLTYRKKNKKECSFYASCLYHELHTICQFK